MTDKTLTIKDIKKAFRDVPDTTKVYMEDIDGVIFEVNRVMLVLDGLIINGDEHFILLQHS